MKTIIIIGIVAVILVSGCIEKEEPKAPSMTFEQFVEAIEECKNKPTPHYWDNNRQLCISELDEDNCVVLEEWESFESTIYPRYFNESEIIIYEICKDYAIAEEYQECEAGVLHYKIRNNKRDSLSLVCW